MDERLFGMLKRQGKAFDEDTTAAYMEHGGTPWLDGAHTVFGQVIEGMETVDAIAAVRVDRSSRPYEEISITGISVSTVE